MAEDITNPVYLTRQELGARSVRTLSGRGTVAPGYTIIGTQDDAYTRGIKRVKVLKMVSPLTGQGPADPMATGRHVGMNGEVLTPRIVRQAKTVASNTGSKVIRPPRTALRRMTGSGQGIVSFV